MLFVVRISVTTGSIRTLHVSGNGANVSLFTTRGQCVCVWGSGEPMGSATEMRGRSRVSISSNPVESIRHKDEGGSGKQCAKPVS